MQRNNINLSDKLRKVRDEIDLFTSKESTKKVDYKDFFRQIKKDYNIEID